MGYHQEEMPQEEQKGPGRPIGECIALAKRYEEVLGYPPVPDATFAADVESAVFGDTSSRRA